jgi:hypothetical protein
VDSRARRTGISAEMLSAAERLNPMSLVPVMIIVNDLWV